jgi:hypothetical protein
MCTHRLATNALLCLPVVCTLKCDRTLLATEGYVNWCLINPLLVSVFARPCLFIFMSSGILYCILCIAVAFNKCLELTAILGTLHPICQSYQ